MPVRAGATGVARSEGHASPAVIRKQLQLALEMCSVTGYTTPLMEKSNVAIGHFIRQQVIPTGMSVTEAARRLCVSRPALSKLLNGRVSLSTAMALRLERTFGADRRQLLDLQTTSERDRLAVTDRAVTVGGAYIPDFLTIKAKQIADWAATIDARNHLACSAATPDLLDGP